MASVERRRRVDDETLRICVFCGSSHGAADEYAVAARALGREIVDRDEI